MTEDDSSRQHPTQLGPSGTQRLSSEKPKKPQPPAVMADVIVKAYLLRQRAGQGEQSRIPIEGDRIVVGREDADVNVNDDTVSSQHFAIEFLAGAYTLVDLGSSNGTAVNGTEVQSAPLTTGDRIQAGKASFVFRTIQTIPWSEES